MDSSECKRVALKAAAQFFNVLKDETHSMGEYDYASKFALNFIQKHISNDNVFSILKYESDKL